MSEDIWAEFDDWRKTTFLNAGGSAKNLIIVNNIKSLSNIFAWRAKVKAFEEHLVNITTEENREEVRNEYCIHFDGHSFDRSSDIMLNFDSYHFPCSISFENVEFGDGGVSFVSATFAEGNVSFLGATFGLGIVSFENIQFGDGLFRMTRTKFHGDTLTFRGAKFGGGSVILEQLQLSRNISLFARFMEVDGTLFISGNFAREANFNELKVTETSIFTGSTFNKCPDFRNTEFGRPPEVNGMEIPSPKMKGEKLFYIFKTSSDADDASKYRKLNAMAKAANDHDKELEFFAYEMMAKRGVEITGFWELLANSFYYHVSYYGQSWTRPLIGMAISCFTFFWIYFIYAMGSLKCLENVWFSIKYSMLNTLPFVSALYRSSIQPKDYESGLMVDLDKLATVDGEMVNGSLGGLMFLSFCQQFIGIVLLFFLLLGLRNRFRLK